MYLFEKLRPFYLIFYALFSGTALDYSAFIKSEGDVLQKEYKQPEMRLCDKSAQIPKKAEKGDTIKLINGAEE